MTAAVLPGATVGVLGSGQLGRMFAIAARRMGYRVHTYSPDYDTPTGQVADVEITAPYEDLDAVRAFAAKVDVVTFEFENVPAAAVEAAAELAPVRPEGSVLAVTQHRLREKTFLAKAGFPVTTFAEVRSLTDLEARPFPDRMPRRAQGLDDELRRQGTVADRPARRCRRRPGSTSPRRRRSSRGSWRSRKRPPSSSPARSTAT